MTPGLNPPSESIMSGDPRFFFVHWKISFIVLFYCITHCCQVAEVKGPALFQMGVALAE